MSVLISGALIDGAGVPMSGCHIILKSRVNTAEVVMRTVADVVTGNHGEYSFEAQTGKYCVYLKQDWRDEYRVGDIAVYDDSKPGTLNDFLTALDEGDLKPDIVRRFEELVAQAQQSAEVAAESAQVAGLHVADTEKNKKRVEALAGEVKQSADSVTENKQQVEQLASEVAQNASQVQQGVEDVNKGVQKAQQAAQDSASSAGAAANARAEADSSAATASQAALDSEASKADAVNAADAAHRYHNSASLAATNAELAANTAQGHSNNAAEWARQAKANQEASAGSAQEAQGYRDSVQQIVDSLNATNATTTQKGLVQLSSVTDSDSEELAATPKAVKAVMEEVQTRAPLDSPAFSGTPTSPTPDLTATGREVANAAFVRALISALVDSSPEALDTLNELAAALGNDPNFATTVTNALAGKQPLNDILTSLSGLVTAGNKLPYFSDKNVLALANLTAVGRVLIGQNSRSEVLQYLGITDMLSSTTGNLWGSPGVGGLIMAAYCGESDDDNNRKLIRGNIVPGSRLGMITLSGSYSTTGTYVSTPRLSVVTPNKYPQAGTFMALSGNTQSTGEKDSAMVGLFIRIA